MKKREDILNFIAEKREMKLVTVNRLHGLIIGSFMPQRNLSIISQHGHLLDCIRMDVNNEFNITNDDHKIGLVSDLEKNLIHITLTNQIQWLQEES